MRNNRTVLMINCQAKLFLYLSLSTLYNSGIVTSSLNSWQAKPAQNLYTYKLIQQCYFFPVHSCLNLSRHSGLVICSLNSRQANSSQLIFNNNNLLSYPLLYFSHFSSAARLTHYLHEGFPDSTKVRSSLATRYIKEFLPYYII